MTFCSPLPMFLNTNDTKWPKRLFACPSGDFEMAWLWKRIKDPQRKQVRLTSKPCSRDQRHQPLSQPPSLQQKLPLKICRTKMFDTLTTCNFQPNRKIHRISIASLYTPQKKIPGTPHRFSLPQSNALHRSSERSRTLRPEMAEKKSNFSNTLLLRLA